MFKSFLEQIKVIRTARTYNRYRQVLSAFEGKAVNKDTVLEFMERKDLSVNTKKDYLGIWISALKSENLLTTEINTLVKGIRREEKIQPSPTMFEVQKILNATDSRMFTCIIALMAFAGLRIGEVLNLKLSDIKADKILIRETKNHSQRYVPISENLRPYLFKWFLSPTRTRGEYLFNSMGSEDGRYAISYFQRKVKEYCAKAGFKEYHCHSFRHFFATTLYKKSGHDIALTARACGHKSYKTTMRYISTEIDDIASAVNMF